MIPGGGKLVEAFQVVSINGKRRYQLANGAKGKSKSPMRSPAEQHWLIFDGD
jgi:hypothetical protein